MIEFDEDVLDAWYKMARKIVEYKPEATLWDLFRFQMLWEHGEDIDKVIASAEKSVDVCIECNEVEEIHAIGKCEKCYKRQYMRKYMREKRNEIK